MRKPASIIMLSALWGLLSATVATCAASAQRPKPAQHPPFGGTHKRR